MADFTTDRIRNVALVGHGDSGKTTLAEAALHKAGEISRLGRVQEGTTTSDFDPDEKSSGHSIDSSVLHLTWQDRLVHVLDTPGYPDYIGAAIASFVRVLIVCTSLRRRPRRRSGGSSRVLRGGSRMGSQAPGNVRLRVR